MPLPCLLPCRVGPSRALAARSQKILLLCILSAGLACSRAPERVVLVTIDTLRADFVGCYGAAAAHTPTIDGLAEVGVRFTNAISPAPLTLPSHASLLTGLDPPQHGLRGNGGQRLPDEIPTLAERLRTEGFATAAFVGAKVLDRQFGIARGFDVYDDRMSSRRAGGDLSYAERSADVVVDSALAWLEDAPSRFLLWVHLYDPHGNYKPPPGFLAMFPSDPYVGEIAFADAEIGRLLARVHERFDDGLTLTVVTSDHGESRGEHGELTHSLTIYDATQHVPLVVSGPGFRAGVSVERLVGVIDVAPTILSALGAPPLPGARGVDLRTVIEDAYPAERLLYLETLEPHATFGWSPLLGLRSQSRKYIRAPRPELYELVNDPRELHNKASERGGAVARLDATLSERLTEVRRAPALAIDAGTRAALQALGYLAPEAPGEVGGIDPKDAMPMAQRFMVALGMHGSGRTKEALEVLATIEGGGGHLDAARAMIAREAGDAAAAERYARAACLAEPELAGAWGELGKALEAQGRLDAAAKAFGAARERDTSSGEPIAALGRIAEAHGHRERARSLYAEATEARNGTEEARWRLAALQIEALEVEEADAELALLAAETILEPVAAVRLARAEAAAGLVERARQRLDAAREKSPDSPLLHEALDELGPGP